MLQTSVLSSASTLVLASSPAPQAQLSLFSTQNLIVLLLYYITPVCTEEGRKWGQGKVAGLPSQLACDPQKPQRGDFGSR